MTQDLIRALSALLLLGCSTLSKVSTELIQASTPVTREARVEELYLDCILFVGQDYCIEDTV